MVRVLLQPPPARPRPSLLARTLGGIRWIFLLAGCIALGYSGYAYLDSHLYEAYQDWSFNQESQGKTPSLVAFLQDAKALESLISPETGRSKAPEPSNPPQRPPSAPPVHRSDSSLIGRIEIPRLNVHAIIQEGVDDRTLRRSVGHVPGTARPGADGNIALAAHRDTFFRGLRGVRKDDLIVLETLDARYEYVVDSLQIVQPSDVKVLAPTKDPVLTLVTCYPFSYVGHAPRRFIVRARQVSVEARWAAVNAPAPSGS